MNMENDSNQHLFPQVVEASLFLLGMGLTIAAIMLFTLVMGVAVAG